jgi:hypothetical protein
MSPNENNVDVLEIDALVTLVKAFENNQLHIWSVGKFNIPIEITGPKVDPRVKAEKEPVIFALPVDGDNQFIIITLGTLVVVCLFLSPLVFKTVIRRIALAKEKKELATQISSWDKKFVHAASREDFEHIYQYREEWEKLLESKTANLNVFYQVLDKHQYKQNWEEFELTDTQNSFEPIRRIFSNGI